MRRWARRYREYSTGWPIFCGGEKGSSFGFRPTREYRAVKHLGAWSRRQASLHRDGAPSWRSLNGISTISASAIGTCPSRERSSAPAFCEAGGGADNFHRHAVETRVRYGLTTSFRDALRNDAALRRNMDRNGVAASLGEDVRGKPSERISRRSWMYQSEGIARVRATEGPRMAAELQWWDGRQRS